MGKGEITDNALSSDEAESPDAANTPDETVGLLRLMRPGTVADWLVVTALVGGGVFFFLLGFLRPPLGPEVEKPVAVVRINADGTAGTPLSVDGVSSVDVRALEDALAGSFSGVEGGYAGTALGAAFDLDPDGDGEDEWRCNIVDGFQPDKDSIVRCEFTQLGPSADSFAIGSETTVTRIDLDGDGKLDVFVVGDGDPQPITINARDSFIARLGLALVPALLVAGGAVAGAWLSRTRKPPEES